MIIIGIDPSLTGTGIARVDTDDRLVASTLTITTKGSATATYQQRTRRLSTLACRDIGDIALGLPYVDEEIADLVIIEAPAYSKSNAGTSMLNGLWWMILNRLDVLGIPYAVAQPTTLKKYATGKGNASKDAVLLAVARRYPHIDVTDNNQADALVLAAMGADHHGQPLVELPHAHREALVKVAWPDAGLPQGAVPAGQDLMAGAGL